MHIIVNDLCTSSIIAKNDDVKAESIQILNLHFALAIILKM